ncbi:MAG: prepilin peptidase [Gammaproteobacteria bacterium]|jgi:prepilin signal peptidase PulO-like enzyme (type II secretory pathway)|nr:prepilin peptidase [Gammaproteobacteria bacterium]
MILNLSILPPWLLMLTLILVSACIGSFLNVVIYRLPLMLDNENISLSRPRSACPNCKHMIAWYDNIPIISYFLLHAACRHCQQKISWRYPLIEFITIFLSLAVYFILGFNNQMLAGLVFTWWLIAMTVIDLEHFLLPDQLTLSLLWLGLLINIQHLFTALSDAVIGAALGYSLLWLINNLYKWVRKKDGLGQGDWKLLAAFGAWFGWMPLFYILTTASFIGAIVGLMAIINKKAKLETALPFGPFLCIGAWLWLLTSPTFL